MLNEGVLSELLVASLLASTPVRDWIKNIGAMPLWLKTIRPNSAQWVDLADIPCPFARYSGWTSRQNPSTSFCLPPASFLIPSPRLVFSGSPLSSLMALGIEKWPHGSFADALQLSHAPCLHVHVLTSFWYACLSFEWKCTSVLLVKPLYPLIPSPQSSPIHLQNVQLWAQNLLSEVFHMQTKAEQRQKLCFPIWKGNFLSKV